MAEAWTQRERSTAVDIYFDMLRLELSGEAFVKKRFIEQAASLIDRSEKSIKYKFQNISAALHGVGAVFIDGYKPMRNLQKLLRVEVEERFADAADLRQLMLREVSAPPSGLPSELPMQAVDVPALEVPSLPDSRSRAGRFVDYQALEAQNRRLGLAGEEAVVRLERQRLERLGRGDLASRVEHVSQTEGDGLGFDVLSFTPDGRERHIEVKTTRFTRQLPFLISRNEFEYSVESSGSFALYRLFRFGRRDAGHYELPGSLAQSTERRPEVFSAWPRSG